MVFVFEKVDFRKLAVALTTTVGIRFLISLACALRRARTPKLVRASSLHTQSPKPTYKICAVM